MAEKDLYSCDKFPNENEIESLGNLNRLLEDSKDIFVAPDYPFIVLSECSSQPQIKNHENVPLKIHENVSLKVHNVDKNDKNCLNNPSSSASSGSRPKNVAQLSHTNDRKCLLERAINDNLECLNFRVPVEETTAPSSSKGISNTNPDRRGIPDICWEDYKSFLFRVWREKSLEDYSIEDEASKLPPISSLSGDVPYVLELVAREEEQMLPNGSSTSQPPFYGKNLMNSKQNTNKYPPLEERRSSQNDNLQSLSVLEKNFQPHPLAKETSNIQGETNSRPTLSVRSKAFLEPLKEGGSCHPEAQKEFKNPLNVFSKRDHKMSTQGIQTKTDPYQNNTNKNNDVRLNLALKTNQQKPVFPGYETGTNLSLMNKQHSHHLGGTNRQERKLCFHRDEIQDLKIELEKAQSRIASLSFKMEDQSTHLERLIEERNSLQERFNQFLQQPPQQVIPGMTYPLFPQQGYKSPHLPMYPSGMETYTCSPHQAIGRRASWQYPCELPRGRCPSGYKGAEHHEELMSHLSRTDPRALEDLRDRIVALQMQNIELNLFLKKEEVRRKEAEEAVRKEKEYVRKLQQSIQDISSSTLVIDPMTYKQVADNYIASKKNPVRRTHTCNPYIGSSDLVCDSNRLQVAQNKNQSNSCPSSPLGSNHDRKSSSSKLSSSTSSENRHQDSSQTCSRYGLQETDLSMANPNLNWSMDVRGPSPAVSSHQYQELLNSLDGLQVSSSPS